MVGEVNSLPFHELPNTQGVTVMSTAERKAKQDMDSESYNQGYLDGYRAAHQKALDMFKSWLDDRSHLQ